MTFDPYAECLDIRPDERPIDFYRLLGVPRFEQDVNKISRSADARVSLLHSRRTAENSPQIQHVLNEIGEAKRWLLDPRQKTTYDHQLQAMQPTRPQSGSAETPLAGPGRLLNPPSSAGHGGRETQLPSPPAPSGQQSSGERPLAGPKPIRDVPTPGRSRPAEFPLAAPAMPGAAATAANSYDEPQIAVPRSAPPGHIPSLQEIAARQGGSAAAGNPPRPGGPAVAGNPIQSPPPPGAAVMLGGAAIPSPGNTPAMVPNGNEPHAQPPEPAPPEAAPPMQGAGGGLPPVSVDSPSPNAPPAEEANRGPAVYLSPARSGRRQALGFPLWVPVTGFICLMLVLGALVGLALTLTGDNGASNNSGGSGQVGQNASSTNSAAANQQDSSLTAQQRRDRVKKQLAEQARQSEAGRLQRTKDGRIIDPAIGVVVKPPDPAKPIVSDDPLDAVVGGTVGSAAAGGSKLVRVALPDDALVATARTTLVDRLASTQPADLLKDAFDDAHSLESRYVMLDSARATAARRGEVRLALQAVDALNRQFEIDPIQLKIETLRGMRTTAATPAAYGQVVDGAIEVADSVAGQGDAESYRESLGEALIAARQSGDPELVRRVTRKLISQQAKLSTGEKPPQKPLETESEDSEQSSPPAAPEANPAVEAPAPSASGEA